MFSWITGSGVFKEEQFDEDKEKLAEFYRDKGYIDFEIKDVQFLNPTPRTMIIRFTLYEGTQYKVGSVKFTGNKLFTTQDIAAGLRAQHERSRSKAKIGPNGLPMDVGDTFKPGGLTKDSKEVGLAQDIEAVEDFYGAKGYIDVHAASHNLNVVKIPNTETGTMDLEFQIEEGQKSYIEKIEVRGNTKTKDKVIRRELAVSPGELFDMVRVKLSKQRLEGLGTSNAWTPGRRPRMCPTARTSSWTWTKRPPAMFLWARALVPWTHWSASRNTTSPTSTCPIPSSPPGSAAAARNSGCG
jgi:outer membrane protein insertion porin family